MKKFQQSGTFSQYLHVQYLPRVDLYSISFRSKLDNAKNPDESNTRFVLNLTYDELSVLRELLGEIKRE